MELIAEGININELPGYESLLAEGQKGEVRVYLDRTLSVEEIQQIDDSIRAQGVVLTGPVVQVARVLVISFQKALIPLAIIATVVTSLVAAVLGWQILKTISTIPWWTYAGITGILILVLLLRRR